MSHRLAHAMTPSDRWFSARGVAAVVAGIVLAVSAPAHSQGDASRPEAAPRSTAAASGPLDSIKKWLGSPTSPAELLPPEQAFQIVVRARDATTLVATLTPASNYYLYRDRISFSITDPPTIAVASVSLPKGEPKADPTFGTVEVFHRPFEAIIGLKRSGARADRLELRATYQGCNEPLGVCYPPIEKVMTVALSGAASAESRSQDLRP